MLQVTDLTKEYPSPRGPLPILSDITVTFRRGDAIAIMGPSGSGKTTLMNLLLRFYDPLEGSVEVDGVDLRDLDLEQLRRSIGVVPQESFLFPDSIRGNIAYGRPDSTLEEDAMFWAGEGYFFGDRYAKASRIYSTLVKEYPSTRHLDTVAARQFALADYWLDLHREDPDWPVTPNVTDRRRPRFDRAVRPAGSWSPWHWSAACRPAGRSPP